MSQPSAKTDGGTLQSSLQTVESGGGASGLSDQEYDLSPTINEWYTGTKRILRERSRAAKRAHLTMFFGMHGDLTLSD